MLDLFPQENKIQNKLPLDFNFKTLGTNHLDEIFNLLNNHYIEDDQHIVRLTYSRDFIYWYIKNITPGLILGLLHKKNLVGIITSMLTEIMVNDEKIKIAYIDFLCVQTNIRGIGLGTCLYEEINLRLRNMGIMRIYFTLSSESRMAVSSEARLRASRTLSSESRNRSLGGKLVLAVGLPETTLSPKEQVKLEDSLPCFTSQITGKFSQICSDSNSIIPKSMEETQSFCTTHDYIIPINYPKLKQIGFLDECEKPNYYLICLGISNDNPLHLMAPTDIDDVVSKLNKFMNKYIVRPYFTKENARYFLFPKKNIVYSFVKKNSDGKITDFISVYKNYLYCIEKNIIINVAHLAYYFYETLNLTELVSYLLEKLSRHKIDQLYFRNMADNSEINITKFVANGRGLNHYMNNMDQMAPSKLIMHPF